MPVIYPEPFSGRLWLAPRAGVLAVNGAVYAAVLARVRRRAAAHRPG